MGFNRLASLWFKESVLTLGQLCSPNALVLMVSFPKPCVERLGPGLTFFVGNDSFFSFCFVFSYPGNHSS